MMALVAAGIAEPLANAAAFALSAQANFLISRRWTWADRTTGSGSALAYHASAILSLAVNTAVFVATYRLFGVVAGALLAGMTSAALNFLLCAYVVFRRRGGIENAAAAALQPLTSAKTEVAE